MKIKSLLRLPLVALMLSCLAAFTHPTQAQPRYGPVSGSVDVPASLPSAQTISSTDQLDATDISPTAYYADFFRISVAAAGQLEITQDSGNDLDTLLKLTNASGEVIAVNDDDDTGVLGVGSRIVYSVTEPGIYYIIASTFGNRDTGAYTLNVVSSPTQASFVPPQPSMGNVSYLLEKNVAFSYQLAGGNGNAPSSSLSYSQTSGTLPAGMTVGPNGLLSGTPTTIGATTATIEVSNGSATASGTLRIEILNDLDSPRVTAPTSANIANTSATLGGTASDIGSSAITERGVVYAPTSVDADPNIGDAGVTKVVEGAKTTGAFTVNVAGLTPNTNYSFAAYATSFGGTNYSPVATFTTTISDPTGAAGLVVTTTQDVTAADGFISLREAIIRANSDGANSTITFAVSGTIRLTRVLNDLTNDGTLTISNAQSGAVIISGDANDNGANDNGDVGLFAMGTGADVTLKGLTLRDGRRNFGGAVFNNGGKLTLINSTLTKNVAFADGGGAISNINANGVVTITNCTLSDNSASGFGGAISSGGSVFITDSTLSGNTSGNQGGAINSGGPLEISGSKLSSNSASLYGGAINSSTSVTIITSTLSGNTSGSFGGAINIGGPLEISGSKLSDNTAVLEGGAIRSYGAVTISTSTLSSNSVTSSTDNVFGGAIRSSGALTITSSTLSDNTATASGNGTYSRGGAIYTSSPLTITGSTLSGNAVSGQGFGGAIFNTNSTTITNSTLRDNSASASGGVAYSVGALTVTGSTLRDNKARFGAALYGSTANVTGANDPAAFVLVRNSTLTGNIASVRGGALLIFSGLTVIESSTLAGNSAPSGSGIVLNGADTTSRCRVVNSIIADNRTDGGGADSGSDVALVNGTNNGFVSAGYNAIGDGNGAANFAATGDQTGVTAAQLNLGALAPNGGPTQTRALSFPSVAINSGDTTLTTDQRGVARPQAGRADKGAFELEAASFSESLVVTTLDDEDNGTSDARVGSGTSLREAILRANSDGVASTITFSETVFGAPRQTIVLNGTGLPRLALNGTLTITAPAAGVEISGDKKSQVFVVDSDADVTMTGLTIRDGNASSGGGIYNFGTLTLDSCTLTDNRAQLGGALYSQTNLSGRTLTLRNCTLSGNTATTRGGGLRNFQGLSVIESCTIVGNEAPAGEGGGGVASRGDAGTRTEVRNSIIAGNTSSDVDSDNGINSFRSNDFNLIGVGNATGAFNASGDVINNTAPGVAALADNMGRVPTRALLAGSPAINAGDPAFDGAGKTDARGPGFARVRDGRLDIGAFEVQNTAPVATSQSVTTLSSQSIAITLSATDADGDNLTYSVTQPANGKVTLAGNVATYTSNFGYVGADSFTFKANDGKADSNVATVNINVVAGPAPPESGLVVTTLADIQASDGVTSLREAVDAANRDGKDSPITFAVSGTINLTGGELTLVNDGKVSIVGPAKGITINGDGKSRVFNIVSGADATLSGLNITGGGNSAILNDGALTINGSALFNNTSGGNGGAILNNGALSIANTTLAGNNASGNGGAIFNAPTATLSSLNSTIAGNTATSGGGIFKGKSLTLSNSIVVGNTNDNLSAVADAGGNNITSGTGAAAGLDAAGLKDNGGAVKTIALTTRGTAVNVGDNAAAKGLTTDARGAGFPRVVSGKVDVGAFESAFGNRAPSLNNATFSTSANVPFSMQLTGADADGDSLSYSRAGGTLPDGITLSPTGLLSGTPTKVGRYDFQINVFDGTDVTVARFIVIVSSNSDGIGPVITRAALNASYTRDEFASIVYRGTVRDVAPNGVTPSGVAQVTFQLRRDSDGFAYSGNETDGFTSNVNLGYFPAFLSDPTPNNTAGTRDYRRTFSSFVPSASVLKPGGYSLVIAAKDVAGNFSVEVVPVAITAATAPASSTIRGSARGSGGES